MLPVLAPLRDGGRRIDQEGLGLLVIEGAVIGVIGGAAPAFLVGTRRDVREGRIEAELKGADDFGVAGDGIDGLLAVIEDFAADGRDEGVKDILMQKGVKADADIPFRISGRIGIGVAGDEVLAMDRGCLRLFLAGVNLIHGLVI